MWESFKSKNVKIGVIAFFTVVFALLSYFATLVKTGQDTVSILKDDSYLIRYYDIDDLHFARDDASFLVMTKEAIYSDPDVQARIYEMTKKWDAGE